jgi:hypothetical protein
MSQLSNLVPLPKMGYIPRLYKTVPLLATLQDFSANRQIRKMGHLFIYCQREKFLQYHKKTYQW